jgi:hypothetical protein
MFFMSEVPLYTPLLSGDERFAQHLLPPALESELPGFIPKVHFVGRLDCNRSTGNMSMDSFLRYGPVKVNDPPGFELQSLFILKGVAHVLRCFA